MPPFEKPLTSKSKIEMGIVMHLLSQILQPAPTR